MSIEKIKNVVSQILNRAPATRGKGEQATKQSLVLPLIDALGYDIWDASEVCPEYEADFAIKKLGQKEKVDIAVIFDSHPRIYIETKPIDESLDGHEGQLARYFNATQSVTLGALTNGIEWRFYTDTGDPNVMDLQPFHVARFDASDQGLEVLLRFAKSIFSPESIRDYATELRYTAQMADFLRKEMDLRERDPSEYFIRWVLKSEHMYNGVVNANVVERFKPITKDALTRVIREIVRRSISAMEQEAAKGGAPVIAPTEKATVSTESIAGAEINSGENEDDQSKSTKRKIETTEREIKIFEIVKSIFDKHNFKDFMIFDGATRKEMPVELGYKDTTGYFGIYLNKPTWWVIRYIIDGRKNWIGFNIDSAEGSPLIPSGLTKIEPSPYADFRVHIDKPEDIQKLESLVLKTIQQNIKEREKKG